MLCDVIVLSPFLFALSGLLGATLFLAELKAESNWIYIVPALPFGIACAFLCLRPILLAIGAVAGYCLVWAAALYSAAHLCGNDVNEYFAVSLSGLFGGIGVACLTSLNAPRLRIPSSLTIAGAIGAAFALPFALYAKPLWSGPLSEDAILRISFTLWQAAVGTYVYWIGAANRATSSAA